MSAALAFNIPNYARTVVATDEIVNALPFEEMKSAPGARTVLVPTMERADFAFFRL